MNGFARGTRWLAALVLGLAAGCGGGAGSDLGGADTNVPNDVMDVASPDAADPGVDRDLVPVDPGRADEGPGDLPAGEVLADVPADALLDPGASDVPSDPGTESCPRLPAPADRVRKVAVSLPYDTNGDPANAWMFLDLSAEGALAPTGTTLQMGPAFGGQVTFTPDGAVGIVPQNDGTLGVFRVGADGTPVVVHAAFKGSFYADRVVMAPEGDHAWVLDGEWANIGGGVYRVDIACDGTLSDQGRVLASKLPRALLPLPGRPDRAVLAADDTLGSPAGMDVHLLGWGASPTLLGSAQAFGADAIVTGATVTPDGKYVLLGDNDEISGTPNSITVVAVTGDSLSLPGNFPFNDPVVLLAAPAGGTVLAMSGYGNALFVLDRDDGNATTPFSNRGEVAYMGGKPQLPGAAALIDRGALSGMVLVTEVAGIRTVWMKADGTVTDLGVTSLGEGYTGMPGAIGVQP